MSTDESPPYTPKTSSLGGIPDVSVDIPLCSVFIILYLACAVTSATIFRSNQKRGHRFLISILFTGFCMARVLTCVLRIAWATRLGNVSLSIAAGIFSNVGVFLLYIINILFAQRILRARKPDIGWHGIFHWIMIVLYCLIAVAAVIVITFTILSYYTKDMDLLIAALDLQRASSTYLLIFVLLPYIMLAVAHAPGKSSTMQDFGHGRMVEKTLVLLVLISLMALEQGFKFGIIWVQESYPVSHPPWYHSKACFYCFGFMLEILYLISALSCRVDLRFHVPNGSSRRRTYLESSEEKLGAVRVDSSIVDA